MSRRKSDIETPRDTFSNRTHALPSTPGKSRELMLTPCFSFHERIYPVVVLERTQQYVVVCLEHLSHLRM